MGLCSAGRGSCPTFARAFLFLRVAQRKQQWEGKESPQGSLCFRGTEGEEPWQRGVWLPVLPPSSGLPFGPQRGERGQRGLWRCAGALATCITMAPSISVQKELPRTFRYIKFQVQSNWGNPEYTCVYRVQVHGKTASPNDHP